MIPTAELYHHLNDGWKLIFEQHDFLKLKNRCTCRHSLSWVEKSGGVDAQLVDAQPVDNLRYLNVDFPLALFSINHLKMSSSTFQDVEKTPLIAATPPEYFDEHDFLVLCKKQKRRRRLRVFSRILLLFVSSFLLWNYFSNEENFSCSVSLVSTSYFQPFDSRVTTDDLTLTKLLPFLLSSPSPLLPVVLTSSHSLYHQKSPHCS